MKKHLHDEQEKTLTPLITFPIPTLKERGLACFFFRAPAKDIHAHFLFIHQSQLCSSVLYLMQDSAMFIIKMKTAFY